jgi:drug/metabolite transporter (DMT)-like permease
VSSARNDTSALPILLAVLAILVLTAMDAIIKRLTDDWSTLDLVATRYTVGALCCIPLVLIQRPPRPSPEMLKANAMRAVVVLATALLFFYALAKLPLVEAVVFSYLAPLFMALLGRLMLGERVSPATGIAIVLGFAGVIVIAVGKGLGTTGFGADLLGIVAALAAAFTYALAMVLLRQRTASDHIAAIVTAQNLFAALLALPLALALGDPLALMLREWPSALAIGALGTVGHLLFAEAFKRAPAARIGAVEYTGFIWAVPIGLFFFGEWPSVAALAGAALIISGSLLLLRKPKPA